MVMRRASVGVVMTALLFSCGRAVAPGEPPRISEQGRDAVRRLVFLLKTLRTIHDMRQMVERFDFLPVSLDSPIVDPATWDPLAIGEILAGSRAKARSAPPTPVDDIRIGLEKSRSSASPRDTTVWWDSILVDSLLAEAARQDTFRIAMAFSPDSGWDSGWDTLVGRWSVLDGDTVPVYDGVRRARFRDSASTRRWDGESWRFAGSGATLVLAVKEQVLSNANGRELYRRRADINGEIVADSVRLPADSGVLTLLVKRRDSSRAWWNRVASSLILEYRDVLAYVDRSRTRSLVESSFDFGGGDSAQGVKIRTRFGYGSGAIDSSVTLTSEQWRSPGGASLVRWEKTDYYANRDTVSYLIPAFGADASGETLCTLSIKMAPLPANRPTTQFGAADSSRLWYALRMPGSDGSLIYENMYRSDYYASSNPVARTDWEYVPVEPAPLRAFSSRPDGVTTVTASYRGNQLTAFRRWRLVRGNGTDSVTLAWSGDSAGSATGLGGPRDTLTLIIVGTGDSYLYESRVEERMRGGAIRREGREWRIDDTLYAPSVRVVRGALDSAGRGRLSVTGIDTFEIEISADSVEVACGAGSSCPLELITWRRTDNLYTTRHASASGTADLEYRFTLNPAGFIFGRFGAIEAADAAALPSAENVSVSPLNRGTAEMRGVFELDDAGVENPASVRETLRIWLWEQCTLAGETVVQ